mmetsp:Transcript_44338/g.86748  ORF Transcript_44338/g.86748 Transcript_44338/m.86748 type:complete len:177 (+) Transcript_44338:8094-8624(+)
MVFTPGSQVSNFISQQNIKSWQSDAALAYLKEALRKLRCHLRLKSVRPPRNQTQPILLYTCHNPHRRYEGGDASASRRDHIGLFICYLFFFFFLFSQGFCCRCLSRFGNSIGIELVFRLCKFYCFDPKPNSFANVHEQVMSLLKAPHPQFFFDVKVRRMLELGKRNKNVVKKVDRH